MENVRNAAYKCLYKYLSRTMARETEPSLADAVHIYGANLNCVSLATLLPAMIAGPPTTFPCEIRSTYRASCCRSARGEKGRSARCQERILFILGKARPIKGQKAVLYFRVASFTVLSFVNNLPNGSKNNRQPTRKTCPVTSLDALPP